AVIADRNAQPRSQQLQVGPSQVGGCRELLRAGLFESETMAEPETNWATAAHVGQVMGADLERVFGERLDAITQQTITATFGMLGGVQISGSSDLIFVGDEQISDLKSSDDIGGVLYDLKRNVSLIESLLAIRQEGLLYAKNIETPDGGYELTEVLVSKIAKLHYYVQVAIYVCGAIQQGILGENASGRLVFYDRSGGYQGFVALIITPEEIDLFYSIAQMRLGQVVEAQMTYEQTGGNPAVIAPLRDMAPSFCFSPKVMCPRRMHCWAGSAGAADNRITSAEHVAAVNRYTVGRDLEKLRKGRKQADRAELEGVQGMLPDGKMLTWTNGGAINVVETTVVEPQAQARLDEYVPPVDVVGEVLAEQERKAAGIDDSAVSRQLMRERELGKMQKPELVALCTAAGLEPKGVKATLIGRILDHEAEHGEIQTVAPDGGGKLLMPSEIAPDPQGDVESFTEELIEAAQRPVEISGSVGTDPRPMEPEEAEQVAISEALQQVASRQKYEEVEVLRRRQELFGLDHEHLLTEARQAGVSTNVPRQFMIQAIIDAEFQPVPGRGWSPGASTADPTTDRLRQMRYDADPAMRRNYEGGQTGAGQW